MATGMLVNAVVETAFMPNCANFSELIRTGDLDFALLKPIDTQFLVFFEKVNMPMLVQVFLAGALMVYALSRLDVTITAGRVAWGTPAARWMLIATVLGSGMAFLDSTVVTVALPAIQGDLDTGLAGLQWIVNGYMVTLSALILLSGSLSDRFGRVRLFMVGVTVFALASALCTFAPTLEWLVAGRVLQGVGGALLTPGSLAILQAGFREDDRARAIGAWSGLTGVAAAVGPFVGGWLVQIGDWRLIFLINLPIAVVVLLIARFKVPESRDVTAGGRLDYNGALLGVVALAGITPTFTALGRFWRFLRRPQTHAFLAGVSMLAAIVLSVLGSLNLYQSWIEMHERDAAAAEYFIANGLTHDVVMYRDASALYLLSGNPAIAIPFDTYPLIERAARAYGARWLVISRQAGELRAPLGLWDGGRAVDEAGNRADWLSPEPVYEANDVRVYEVLP